MLKLDEIQKRLLKEVADLHKVPEGAYNIRSNVFPPKISRSHQGKTDRV